MSREEEAAREWLKLAESLTGSPREREVVLTEGTTHVALLLAKLDATRAALQQLRALVEPPFDDPDPTLDIEPTQDLP